MCVCVIDLDGIRGTREQHNERDVRSNLFVTIKRKVYGTRTERLDASRDSKDRRYVIGKLESQFSCFENEMFLEGNTMSAILTGSTEYKSRRKNRLERFVFRDLRDLSKNVYVKIFVEDDYDR